MPRPNLPPGPRDDARFIGKMRTLERRVADAGPRTFDNLDDVDFASAADGDVATYIAATGKIEPRPAALTARAQNFIDTTGISVGAGTDGYLPWVDNDTGFIANASLLTPGTISGHTGATVIAAGFLMVDLVVSDQTGVATNPIAFAVRIFRPGTGFLEVIGDGWTVGENGRSCSASYQCLAGDGIYVIVTPVSDSHTFSLLANVKQFS